MKNKNIIVEVSRFEKMDKLFKELTRNGAFATYSKDGEGSSILVTLPTGTILQLTQP